MRSPVARPHANAHNARGAAPHEHNALPRRRARARERERDVSPVPAAVVHHEARRPQLRAAAARRVVEAGDTQARHVHTVDPGARGAATVPGGRRGGRATEGHHRHGARGTGHTPPQSRRRARETRADGYGGKPTKGLASPGPQLSEVYTGVLYT